MKILALLLLSFNASGQLKIKMETTFKQDTINVVEFKSSRWPQAYDECRVFQGTLIKDTLFLTIFTKTDTLLRRARIIKLVNVEFE